MEEGAAGVREVERDFSRSGKDISESGEGREISGKVGDAGCATEIFSAVEIPLDIIGIGGDVSVDAVETGAEEGSTDLLGAMVSPDNIPSGDGPCNRSPCSSVSAVSISITSTYSSLLVSPWLANDNG